MSDEEKMKALELAWGIRDYLIELHDAFKESCGEDDEINTIPCRHALNDMVDLICLIDI